MSDRNRDALIGICAILAVVSLIVLLGLFGEIDTTRTWRLTLRTPATSGITDSSRVSLDGVPIGYIRSVALEPTGTWAVRIDADIDEGILRGIKALEIPPGPWQHIGCHLNLSTALQIGQAAQRHEA